MGTPVALPRERLHLDPATARGLTEACSGSLSAAQGDHLLPVEIDRVQHG
jgi:hypothetical protein